MDKKVLYMDKKVLYMDKKGMNLTKNTKKALTIGRLPTALH
jgi:hypothetical protein